MTRSPRILVVLAFALTATGLAGQEVRGEDAREPRLLLHLSTYGPAGWRSRLGPSNLGALLATEEATTIWREQLAKANGLLRALRGNDATFERFRELLLEYGGAVHAAAWIEPAREAGDSMRWSFGVALEPDRGTDLRALAPAADAWLRLALEGLGPPVAAPLLAGERLVAVWAEEQDAAAVLARTAALGPAAVPPADLEHPVLCLAVDAPALLALAGGGSEERTAWLRELLGPATRRWKGALGSAGPRIACELAVEFGPGERGVFAATAAPCPVRAWDRLMPSVVAAHLVAAAAPRSLWEAQLRAAAGWHDLDVETARTLIAKNHGCDIGADLAAHLGNEVLVLWPFDAERPGVPADGFVCVFAVDDAEALKAGLNKLRGRPFVQRAGVMRGPSPFALGGEFVVADGLAFVGVGAAEHAIDALLEGSAVATDAPVVGHATVGGRDPSRLQRTGSFCVTAFAREHFGKLVAATTLLFGARPVVRWWDVNTECRRWLPLLEKHGLTMAEVWTGGTPGEWRFRLTW